MKLCFIDVHAHLQNADFSKDLAGVTTNCHQAGIIGIVNVGCDLADSREVVALAESEPFFWAIVGVHPHDSKSWDNSTEPELEKLLKHERVLGLGEVGLDYHYDFSPRSAQKEVFLAQWSMASRLSIPIVVHIRNAFDDFFDLISGKPCPPRVMLHCFSGGLDEARKGLDLGFDFSVGGVITFKKSQECQKVFSFLPDNRIHLETDSPYLAPEPYRGKRNEPAYLVHSFRKLCELRKANPQILSERLIENALTFWAPRLQV